MKIQFLIKSLALKGGGAEKVFTIISNYFFNRGYEIEIVTFDKLNSSTFYFVEKNIKYYYLNAGDVTKNTNFFISIKRIFSLRNHFKKTKPDLIISFLSSTFVFASLANIGLKSILVASEHIVYTHYTKFFWQKFFILYTSFFIDKFTVVSAQAKKTYPHLLRKKMIVIENPIISIKDLNIKKFSRRKIILNIGRLEPQKDQLTLIHSFNKIAKLNNDWKLLIIGDGSLKNEIINLINKYNLKERVEILPFQKNLTNFYLSSSIYVSTSLYESHGLSANEALNFKLPLIAFKNCYGLNKLVDHNQNGILVDEDDKINNLSNVLLKLTNDTQLIEKLRNNIKSTENFDLVKTKWDNLFDNYFFSKQINEIKLDLIKEYVERNNKFILTKYQNNSFQNISILIRAIYFLKSLDINLNLIIATSIKDDQNQIMDYINSFPVNKNINILYSPNKNYLEYLLTKCDFFIGTNFDKSINDFLHIISNKNLFFNIDDMLKFPQKDFENYKINSVENLSFLIMHNLNKK